MAVNFSLPIGHDINDISNIQFSIQKQYRQGVDYEDNNNYCTGVDIHFSNTQTNRTIYSMFGGLLECYKDDGLYSLKLILTNEVKKAFKNISILKEPIPEKIVYKNVDIVSVQNAISNLIYEKYINYPNDKTLIGTYFNNMTIKRYLDINSIDILGAIKNIVENFTSDAHEDRIRLFVSSGDVIGEASLFINGEYAVSIHFGIYDGNFLNPSFYIWHVLNDIILHGEKRFRCLTKIGANEGVFNHPFLSRNGLNIDLKNPKLPRIPIIINNKSTILFPIGQLGTTKGYELTDRSSNLQSKIIWNITNDNNLDFTVSLRNSNDSIIKGKTIRLSGVYNKNTMIDVCPLPDDDATPFDQNVVINKIIPILDDINKICYELQLPVEIIISSIYHETKGEERIVRFEPLKNDEKERKWRNIVGDEIVDNYKQTINPNGFSRKNNQIPINVDITNSNTIVSGKSLTWGQLMQIINYDGSLVSPGIMQQLVSTAMKDIIPKYLRKWYSETDIIQKFGITSPLPNTNIECFNWLLTAKNSVLLAVLYHKNSYIKYNTRFDLILQCSSYNASVKNGKVKAKTNSPWLAYFYGDNYPLEVSKCFNFLQRNKDLIQLTSRFYKSI